MVMLLNDLFCGDGVEQKNGIDGKT